ncbi:MAG: hypothetical protein AVDCRST_MAG11-2654, partial [uncultured Gemmatimonadaceae bacterium]
MNPVNRFIVHSIIRAGSSHGVLEPFSVSSVSSVVNRGSALLDVAPRRQPHCAERRHPARAVSPPEETARFRIPAHPLPRMARTGPGLVVHKFGGAALVDARAVAHAAMILARHQASPTLVVVSAMGGVTDALLDLVRQAAAPGAPAGADAVAPLR